MSFFTSRRERNLWLLTLSAVAAIYATLGLAGLLAERLSGTDLNVILFLLGMFLVGATILTQGLKRRPGTGEIGVALGIGTVYFMLFARMAFAERSHLIEYTVVALLIYEALMERAANGLSVPLSGILTVATTAVIGALDEFIQLFLPNRVFDPVDIFFNAMAAVFAVAASAVLASVRERRRAVKER